MMTRARSLAVLAALIFVVCVYLLGQSIRPSSAQDVGFSTNATVPQPATTAPASEAATGAATGAGMRYAREDHVHARLTRAVTVTTVSGGTFSGTWAQPLSAAPVVILTPISPDASIDCQLTASPTTTGFQGRCWTAQTTALNLTIVTAGINLNPMANTASGVQVQVIALPATQ